MRSSMRIAAVGLACCATMATGVAAAVTGQDDSGSTAPPSIESPMALVEDYSYPGADHIYAERGIRLIEGDGNILLLPEGQCGSVAQPVVVYSSEVTDKFCFDVQNSEGYLTMRVPDVYLMKGDNHTINATITVGDETTVKQLKEDGFTPIGKGTSQDSPTATLLKLEASP